MKKLLVTLTFLAILISAQAQELTWEKMHKESEGGWAEDLAVVKGKIWMSLGRELFMSTDNGLSWNYVLATGTQGIYGAGSVNTSFGNDKKIVVSGDSLFFGDNFSPDNGASWKTWSIDGSTLPKWYLSLTVMSVHNKKLYLGALYNGFFQSTDLGKTFTNMNTSLPNAYGYYEPARSIEFYNHQPVIATHSGLHRWNGSSWQHPSCNGLSTTVINGTTAKLVDRIRFLNSKWIVSTNYGIYFSNDQGNNWQRYIEIPELELSGSWYLYSHPPVFYNLDVSNGKIIVSYESSVYISDDGGATWKFSMMDDRVEIKRIICVGSVFVAATSGGIYRSTDGGTTWQKSNKGFERQYYMYIVGKNGEGFMTSSGSGVLKSSDKGKTLTPFNTGIDLLRYVRINSISPDKVLSTQVKYYGYAGTSIWWDYSIYQSGSDKAAWTELDTVPVQTPYISQVSSNGTIAITGSNPASGGKNDLDGIYLSEDDGKTWNKVFTGVTHNNTSYEDHVASMLYEDDTLYVGTSYSGIYKSSNQGETWESISTGLNLPNLTDSLWWQDTTVLVDISTIKRYKNHLYAIGENYNYYGYGALHHSADGGKHWTKIDFSSLNEEHGEVIASGLTVSETDGTIFARMFTKDYISSFVAVSKDFGETWATFGQDFPDGYMYAFDIIGDYFYASGKTGLWRLNSPDSIQAEEEEAVVTQAIGEDGLINFSIYPNPFNTQVTISIPQRDTKASLEIFSLDGRKILTTEIPSGAGDFVWNGTDDSGNTIKQGVYFIRVTRGKYSFKRKIIKH